PIGLEPTSPISRLWRRTHKAALDASLWEHYWNWGVTAAEGETGQTAAIQFGFRFEAQSGRLTAGDLCLSLRSSYGCSEPLKLQLACFQRAEGLSVELEYDPRR